MLHISVGRKSKSNLLFAGSIQLNQIACNLLHFVFGALFHALPSTRTETRNGGSTAIFTFVLSYAMQVVDTDKDGVVVAIDQFDSFLRTTIEVGGYQTRKLTYSVIHMYHIITYLQLVDLLQCHNRFTATCILRAHGHAVIALKYLMVGIAANLGTTIDKSLMQGAIDSGKGDGSGVLIVSNIFEYGLESVGLLDLLSKNIDAVPLLDTFVQIIRKQIKMLVESRLR